MKTGWWKVTMYMTIEGHEVFFDDLSEATQEHICNQIKKGYIAGEIIEEDDELDD